MKTKIYWTLTSELVKKRKKAWDALSKVYTVVPQIIDQPEPPLPEFVAEQHSNSSIYVFELNTDFSFEHCQIINRIFEPSRRADRTALLVGSLDGTDRLKRQARENWMPYLDGVITSSSALADEFAMGFVYTLRYVPYPITNAQCEKDLFLDKFSDFLKTAKLARCANTLIEKVSHELSYLGVTDDFILIDTVAETLELFWD